MPAQTSVRATVSAISPFFIVGDLAAALAFYSGRLGFEVTYQEPEPDPFFAVIARDGVQLMLKAVGENVSALPNAQRHPFARWDAFIHTADPEGLAAEFAERGVVTFHAPLTDTGDGLRGFELTDADGYVLFFGRPA